MENNLKIPKVSVFMITYNHEEYISKALDSILMQEVDFNYEIVIGEDCSTDNTRQILLDYQNRYPDKFKLLLHDHNVGMLSNVINTLEVCTGEYVAFLEGDDYWSDPNKLKIQIHEMENYPQCDMSFHPAFELVDNSYTDVVLSRHYIGNKIFSTSEIILGEGHFCPTASLVFRRRAIFSLPDFFYTMNSAPDYMLQILGSLSGGALYIDKTMSVYRKGHAVSWSKRNFGLPKNEFVAKEVKSRLASIDSKIKMNNFLDKKYNDEFTNEITKSFLILSMFYLENDMLKEFSLTIKKAFKNKPKVSLMYRMVYSLRRHPNFLRIIYKYRWIIKRLKKDILQ